MRRFLLALPAAAALSPLGALAVTTPSPPATTPALTPTPSATATPSPTPSPTPPPSAGTLSLSPTLGPADTTVSIQGDHFRPGEQVTVYWDSPDKSFGQQTADQQGSFKFDAKARAGDPGQHMICAVEPGPQVCAVFKLEATPSPTPSPSASPSPAASPTPAAVPTQTPADGSSPPAAIPMADQPAAVAALLQPPFVVFPALVLLALVGGCAYWIWVGTRRRPAPIPTATVVHRSLRPAAPAPATAVDAPTPEALEPPPPPPPAVPPPPADLPAPRPAADDGLDFPQPGD